MEIAASASSQLSPSAKSIFGRTGGTFYQARVAFTGEMMALLHSPESSIHLASNYIPLLQTYSSPTNLDGPTLLISDVGNSTVILECLHVTSLQSALAIGRSSRFNMKQVNGELVEAFF